MYTNVNLAAPLGALAFLGTALLLAIAALAFIYAVARKKFGLTKLALLTIVLLAGLYLVVLLVFSFASREKVLARGEEKHFCEIDCHLAYSITDVQQPKDLVEVGIKSAPGELDTAGLFWVVTIKTRFDEKTIGPNLGDALLYPNARIVSMLDETGHEYFPAPQAQRALARSNAAGTAMTVPLHPGESYSTTFIFDLPWNIKKPTLLVREGDLVTHFVIGHENSPLHKKTRFQI
jgi:hypothetical protein